MSINKKSAVALSLLIASSYHALAAPIASLPQDPQMQAFVVRALGMTGLHNEVSVVIDASATGCAYATTSGGRQYIGVDPKCVGPLFRESHYQWRAAGILCHEIGHLLSGHTTSEKTDNPVDEAAADEWSGWALYRLGASLEQAQTFAQSQPNRGSKTHSGRRIRLDAVARGWRKGAASANSPTIEAPGNWWERLMGRPLPWIVR